ncbi:MAG TPA: aromatic amino acid ammonia-lyase [Thermoanaerobaculia bacterium]|nr:aromatic amino acid ammonia-lyase [Thermoanaerobaculia bacterium]
MADRTDVSAASVASPGVRATPEPVEIRGEGLTIADVVRVARRRAPVRITADPEVRRKIEASLDYVLEAAKAADRIYGVTTGFGGMANVVIPPGEAGALQENIARFMSTGAGRPLSTDDVRAAMLLRANSHLRGASGLRFELIRRLTVFLNEGVTPRIREFGSIGASGDLTPLAQVMGAVCGLSPHFVVDHGGETIDCLTALSRLGLEPLQPGPKEGLAMINGTSVMTGVAAHCVADARTLAAISLATHGLYLQALRGTNQSFHPFIHQHKPHRGQVLAARLMLGLLEGSGMVRDELDGRHEDRGGEPIQDRYSLRCLPQYFGPLLDGLALVASQVEVEMNCANDNPLIDGDERRSYHGGNFLGQYVGVAMDQLRYFVGLLAKHLDVQIALLMAPEFNQGLPPSLVGNQARKVNMGLKGLQISGNSIMPVLGFLGNSLVDRFPTHAEQFNQNVNSLGLGSAVLARQSIDAACQYMGVALMVATQAVDLRTYSTTGRYDARELLSPATVPLYDAIRAVVGKPPSSERPYVWDDRDQFLDEHIALLAADIAADGRVPSAVERLAAELQ